MPNAYSKHDTQPILHLSQTHGVPFSILYGVLAEHQGIVYLVVLSVYKQLLLSVRVFLSVASHFLSFFPYPPPPLSSS